MTTEAPDVLLDRFLTCANPRESHALLERLVGEFAVPVVRRIVSSKVSGPAGEDIQHDVLLDLIARLHQVRKSGGGSAIGAFNAYTAVAAYHGCREYYRRCFPERHRLQARLRYLLDRHPSLAAWKTAGGEWVCGRREHGRPALRERGLARKGRARDSTREISRLVETVLAEATAPLPFEELVEHAWQRYGVSAEESGRSETMAPIATVETRLTQRERLRELWSEIGELPLRQRVSLLLSMRDEAGGPGLTLFPQVGVASLRQIAAQLAMPAKDLARIWSGLPLSDQLIGQRLSLDCQRVINLRKSARERLNRNMKA